MIARSIKDAFEAVPLELRSEAVKNTLDYVFLSIGHKCLLIVKYNNAVTQILLRPSKISNHYRKFLPKTLKKKPNVRLLHCIIKEFKPEEEEYTTLKLFQDYDAIHSIPTGVYLVSPTDALIYRTNFKDPFYHVTGSMTSPIPLKHPLIPILAMSGHKDYLDVPIANYDDLDIIKGKTHWDDSKIELDFSKKKPIAVFRGGSTGCGWTAETNPRLRAVQLSKQHPDLLDAQLTTITGTMKIHKTRRAGRVNSKEFRVGSRISFEEQSHYKYILHLDGNVGAYRLAQWMLLGSTILLQESGSMLWFQHLMKPWTHYVPVNDRLNDLIEKIQWCKTHESECKQMAEHARTLALEVLTKETLFRELGHAIKTARNIASTNGKVEK
jgi:hypothetical protein